MVSVNPYHTDVKFSCRVNQSLRYVHSCHELIFLVKMSINNPSQKSVVLESSVKPSLGKEMKQMNIQIFANSVALGGK